MLKKKTLIIIALLVAGLVGGVVFVYLQGKELHQISFEDLGVDFTLSEPLVCMDVSGDKLFILINSPHWGGNYMYIYNLTTGKSEDLSLLIGGELSPFVPPVMQGDFIVWLEKMPIHHYIDVEYRSMHQRYFGEDLPGWEEMGYTYLCGYNLSKRQQVILMAGKDIGIWDYRVYGSWVIWGASRWEGGTHNVTYWLYDIETENRYYREDPFLAVAGDAIVITEKDNIVSGHNMRTNETFTIGEFKGEPENISACGNKVFYNANNTLFWFDVATKENGTIDGVNIYQGPFCDGDRLFWMEYDENDGTVNHIIYSYNFTTEQRVKLYEEEEKIGTPPWRFVGLGEKNGEKILIWYKMGGIFAESYSDLYYISV